MELGTMLKDNFGVNKPILLDEIKRATNYSVPYLFQCLRELIERGELVRYDDSVYYIPNQTILGIGGVNPEDVVMRKYIKGMNEVFGIVVGFAFLNAIGATTQVPAAIEVVTNKESLRVRDLTLGGRKFILRKPKCTITSENENILKILETATRFELNEEESEAISNYARANKITARDLLKYSDYYPAQTLKNMRRVLYGLAS